MAPSCRTRANPDSLSNLRCCDTADCDAEFGLVDRHNIAGGPFLVGEELQNPSMYRVCEDVECLNQVAV